MPTRTSNMFAVGTIINLTEILDAFNVEKQDEKQKRQQKLRNKVDICIFCDNENKENKIESLKLLSRFWEKGMKAVIEFKNKASLEMRNLSVSSW